MLKSIVAIVLLYFSLPALAEVPDQYLDLLLHVQAAPDQGDANTCLFMASTGAMELLLNKRDNITDPKFRGKNDLSEPFLIWQRSWVDPSNPSYHFIETAVKSFNYGEAVLEKDWPFIAFNADGTNSLDPWLRHPEFELLPRIQVPKIKTKLLFVKGRKYATRVLVPEDIVVVKKALFEKKSPVIINYNDDDYWHVILIVGYDDSAEGSCYQISQEECNKKGAFYVRDSNGKRFEKRAYNWFLLKANAAAIIELQ